MTRKVGVAAMHVSEGVRIAISLNDRVVMLTVAETETLCRVLADRTLPAAHILEAGGELPEQLREPREPYEPPAITRTESLDRTCCERFAWSGTTHSTYCDASGLIAKWEQHSLLDFNTAKAVALVVRAARAEISIRYTYSSDGDGWIGAYDKNDAPLTGGQCHRGHLVFECLEMALAELSK